MPDAFRTTYNKADACGSTDGELGSVFPCFLATVVTWHHWSKLQVTVLHVGFVVVGSPVLLAFLLLQGL